MNSVKDYLETVKAPWGKMFYDLLFIQLNILNAPKLKILDFGSGLGVTANYYARWHCVTAIEPDMEMIENRYRENDYAQILGGVEHVGSFPDNFFDVIFCHNVLEYVDEREPILQPLLRVLKPGGTLSVVKHNRVGRVFHTAVFGNDPQKALRLVDSGTNDKSNYLGTQHIYTNDELVSCVEKYGGALTNILGMRAFWALGQDNPVKFTGQWYENMLALETKVAGIDEYRQSAFLNHLLFEKRPK